MSKIYFVRHGESMGNVWPDAYHDDDQNFLSPYGVQQAMLCGAYFGRRGIEFDRLVSSKLTRGRHTMSTILQAMGDWKRKWQSVEEFNELHEATVEQHNKCTLTFNDLVREWQPTGRNMLVVTHYYVMQNLCLTLTNLRNVDGHGKVIRNAVPFVWDSLEPDRIRVLDLHHLGDQY